MIANNIVSATMEIKFKSHSTNFPIFTPNFFQHFYSICEKKQHTIRATYACVSAGLVCICVVFFVSLYFAVSRYNFLFLIRMYGSVFYSVSPFPSVLFDTYCYFFSHLFVSCSCVILFLSLHLKMCTSIRE